MRRQPSVACSSGFTPNRHLHSCRHAAVGCVTTISCAARFSQIFRRSCAGQILLLDCFSLGLFYWYLKDVVRGQKDVCPNPSETPPNSVQSPHFTELPSPALNAACLPLVPKPLKLVMRTTVNISRILEHRPHQITQRRCHRVDIALNNAYIP